MCMRTTLTKYFERQQESYIMGTLKNDVDLLFIVLRDSVGWRPLPVLLQEVCENAYNFFWHGHFSALWHSCWLFCACQSVGSSLQQFCLHQN